MATKYDGAKSGTASGISYSATSLNDIANNFMKAAANCKIEANNAKSKKETDRLMAIAWTWESAANTCERTSFSD